MVYTESLISVHQRPKEKIIRELREPGSHRIWYIADAFRMGMSMDEIYALTKIDHWFLIQIEDLLKEKPQCKLQVSLV